eukprot:TRINITY_DN2972_c0_g3_i1.p1 TRINITY_DN2972_c0_g3~~TRINITY_DN2972_c0_g3_i1.p1  ORF type:complete len:615 (+),score=266.91 TRINITY_DN2972_c0_g3_i1:147-1991(+)
MAEEWMKKAQTLRGGKRIQEAIQREEEGRLDGRSESNLKDEDRVLKATPRDSGTSSPKIPPNKSLYGSNVSLNPADKKVEGVPSRSPSKYGSSPSVSSASASTTNSFNGINSGTNKMAYSSFQRTNATPSYSSIRKENPVANPTPSSNASSTSYTSVKVTKSPVEISKNSFNSVAKSSNPNPTISNSNSSSNVTTPSTVVPVKSTVEVAKTNYNSVAKNPTVSPTPNTSTFTSSNTPTSNYAPQDVKSTVMNGPSEREKELEERLKKIEENLKEETRRREEAERNQKDSSNSSSQKIKELESKLAQEVKRREESERGKENLNQNKINEIEKKLEQEAKKRQDLERDIKARDKEISNLTEELRVANNNAQPQKKPNRTVSIKPIPIGKDSDEETRKNTLLNANQVRASRRITKRLTSSLGNVMQELDGLEDKVVKTEEKLLDVAIAKLEVDGVVQQVETYIKKILSSFDQLSSDQIKPMLLQLLMLINDNEKSGTKSRFSLFVPASAVSAIPQAPPMSNAAKTPPVPPRLTRTDSVSSNSSSAGESFSLLDQIRSGKTLRNIDLNKLMKEKEELKAQKNRNSIGGILRGALSARVAEMNLYDGEDDEEDEEESVV